ncbi:TPA: hypothetical protein DEO28_05160 [Candidatus Dependentiae bacterium]|nr:MAG: hypothetical protein UR14_C0002G0145 [candidate division TM6 bacterium GW2011_GWE2_31_21]KKP53942.1 MAG: hypothetical protein UR43_C0002G0145 [candidate division TM6 bacterium GW2011_GWF2_33_332]HBS47722.1 hypothetical protein [Candidatus Dependentiae bacterium]HBZ73871.1 hypothetical protein [Candidatus Dependentiae bacterium]
MKLQKILLLCLALNIYLLSADKIISFKEVDILVKGPVSGLLINEKYPIEYSKFKTVTSVLETIVSLRTQYLSRLDLDPIKKSEMMGNELVRFLQAKRCEEDEANFLLIVLDVLKALDVPEIRSKEVVEFYNCYGINIRR